MTQTILIIDDEEDIRDLLAEIFQDEGYNVLKAAHSEQALSLIDCNTIDLIVLDIWLDNSDMDGMQILRHLKSKKECTSIPVLMISGHGNVEMAVDAMKVGAFDFIEKPFKIDHILLTVQRALEQKSLQEENGRLKEFEDLTPAKHDYKSSAMIALIKQVNEHADSDARILISGAIGTGKTRLAKIIHDVSKRSKAPIRFMHARDFTAEYFDLELSHNPMGTYVLEQVDMLTQKQQTELLKYLNKMQNTTRLVFTSGRKIDDLVKSQGFSSALYDRLAVLRFNMPALKNRMEDITILIAEFIEQYQKELNIEVQNDFLPLEKIKDFAWPGNVKQLKTAVEWMVFCQKNMKDQVVSYTLPFEDNYRNDKNILEYPKVDNHFNSLEDMFKMTLKDARDSFEYQYLTYMLKKHDGNIAQIANAIDMDRTALHRKLKLMNLTFESKARAEER